MESDSRILYTFEVRSSNDFLKFVNGISLEIHSLIASTVSLGNYIAECMMPVALL